MDKLKLNKQVQNKNQYEKVIDTTFSQLNGNINAAEEDSIVSVEEFFSLYEQLFFEIPKFGESNSHEYLVKTSSDYIDFNANADEIQALIDEITTLRQQNLELNQELVSVQAGTLSDATQKANAEKEIKDTIANNIQSLNSDRG